jgi:capsular exopolysaccharide synthesis family protein
VGVTSKVTANPISIVDAATPPLFPFEPNVRNIAMVGLMGGLLLGLAWAFIREYMDDSVKRTEQIEQEFGLPLLGLIPQVSRKDLAKVDSPWRLIVEDPRGMLAEAYRSMRTALQFSTAEGAPRQILVTSTSEGEGKSTTALALAINFAQLGKRVLLVDADMRNPSLHKSLGVPNDRGLSNYLAGEGARDQLVHDTEVPGLSLLTAGPTPPSPADLLMGPRFLRLLEKSSEMGYDQLIVDGPPVLGIADAIVLGNQIPNVIFVVQAGRTRKSSIRNALRRMRLAGLMPLGVALTRLTAEHGHGGAYGGYGYGYGYGYGNASQGAGSAQRLNTARED